MLLRKPRSYAEVYNDLDGDVVNLFRVLRDPEQGARLRELLSLTPFSRAEFDLSYQVSDDPVEEARRLVVRSFMGFGSDGHNRAVTVGFRATGYRNGSTPAHDWANFPEAMGALIERVRAVTIERRDALEVLAQQDRPETLFYVDPPYLPELRSAKSRKGGTRYHGYAHELTREDHAKLLAALRELEGMVVLSGYPSDLYEEALSGWRRVERQAMADGAQRRTEVLWINPAAAAALDRPILGCVA